MKPTKKTTPSKQSSTAANPTRVRTAFSKEFKLQAVELLELGQSNPTELAMELGIRRNQLYKWRDQLKQHGKDAAFSGPDRPTEDQQSEVERLRRELARVTEERDILKNCPTRPAEALMNRNSRRVHWMYARTVAVSFLEV